MLWGARVFVFEAKNYSLPSGNARSEFHFLQETASAMKQVTRLCEGLKRYPEAFREAFGEDLADKEVIAAVLFAAPFSLGLVGEVFVYDGSALRRFFEGPAVNLLAIGPPGSVAARVPFESLWSGSSPSSDDLLKQMEDPFQVRFLGAEYQVIERTLQLSKDAVVSAGWATRLPGSLERILAKAGTQMADILEQLDALAPESEPSHSN